VERNVTATKHVKHLKQELQEGKVTGEQISRLEGIYIPSLGNDSPL